MKCDVMQAPWIRSVTLLKLSLDSEDSCHLDTGYCRVRDGLATI